MQPPVAPLSGTPSPLRKRVRTDPPKRVAALQRADLRLAFYVLSDSLGVYHLDDAVATGPLGFYGTPKDIHTARVIQLAWACAATGS